MGVRNYLVEGPSGAGKTSVATELQRHGHHVVHGDRALAYRGDPVTGERLSVAASDLATAHGQHLWDLALVRALVADHTHPATFFCGGSRNHRAVLHLFDAVFLLDLDPATLARRLVGRGADEFGGTPAQSDFVLRRYATGADRPPGAVSVDATAPLAAVVQAILSRCT